MCPRGNTSALSTIRSYGSNIVLFLRSRIVLKGKGFRANSSSTRSSSFFPDISGNSTGDSTAGGSIGDSTVARAVRSSDVYYPIASLALVVYIFLFFFRVFLPFFLPVGIGSETARVGSDIPVGFTRTS